LTPFEAPPDFHLNRHKMPEPSLNDLWPDAYNELKRIAGRLMSRERSDHTLTPTALVHEVWLNLASAKRPAQLQDRLHFVALAARAMRNILVNHAHARLADKRGSGALHVTLSASDDIAASASGPAELLGVHQALNALAAIDPRAAEVAELKVFGGLDVTEIAAALKVSEPTVKRDWVFARAHLAQSLA
jgi:RNA polymerase sigma factor (TIGR02999 family)